MKFVIVMIICMIICMIGCAGIDNPSDERQRIKTSCNYFGVETFEYKNHEYIAFTRYRQCGVVHNPDCRCKSEP